MECAQRKGGDHVHRNRRAWAEGNDSSGATRLMLTVRRFRKQLPKLARIPKPSATRARISSEYATRTEAHETARGSHCLGPRAKGRDLERSLRTDDGQGPQGCCTICLGMDTRTQAGSIPGWLILDSSCCKRRVSSTSRNTRAGTRSPTSAFTHNLKSSPGLNRRQGER
jgi:hypothetical protein